MKAIDNKRENMVSAEIVVKLKIEGEHYIKD